MIGDNGKVLLVLGDVGDCGTDRTEIDKKLRMGKNDEFQT